MRTPNIFRKPETVGIQQAPGQLPVRVIKGTEPQQAQQPPAAPPSIGQENQPVIDSITNVKRVAVMLAHRGFRLLDIYIGNRNPVIIINPSKRCNSLDGTMIKRTRMQNCLVLTYTVNIEGVQVEWMVPDHG